MAKPSLKTQLAAEFKAHPAKSAVLAVLLVVGGYVYLPILSGVVRGDSSDMESAIPDIGSTVESTTFQVNSPVQSRSTTPFNASEWRAVADQIDAHPHMTSTTDWTAADSPFVSATPQVATPTPTSPDVEVRPAEATVVAPIDSGLVLTSTVTGGRNAVALINGEPYRVGDEVASNGEIVYRVEKITADQVILVHRDRRFELRIVDSKDLLAR